MNLAARLTELSLDTNTVVCDFRQSKGRTEVLPLLDFSRLLAGVAVSNPQRLISAAWSARGAFGSLEGSSDLLELENGLPAHSRPSGPAFLR